MEQIVSHKCGVSIGKIFFQILQVDSTFPPAIQYRHNWNQIQLYQSNHNLPVEVLNIRYVEGKYNMPIAQCFIPSSLPEFYASTNFTILNILSFIIGYSTHCMQSFNWFLGI